MAGNWLDVLTWLNMMEMNVISEKKTTNIMINKGNSKHTLESGLDVGQGITVGPGKFVKKNKRRALNKRRA